MPTAPGSRLRLIADRLRLERDWLLIAQAAAVGALTAMGAMGFIWLVHAGERLSEQAHLAAPTFRWGLVFALPMAGAFLTALLIRYGAREAEGHGVPEVIEAVHRKRGEIRPRVAVVKALASASTIGSGGSAGAEGPIVQIGAALGAGAARALRVSREQGVTLIGCGAAAGIASVFNAPIAGVFFVLEVILRDFSMRTFAPIIVASVMSAAVTQGVLGRNEALFAGSGALTQYQFTMMELPGYLVLGIACGAVSVGFQRVLHSVERRFEIARAPKIAKPVMGAALLGLAGAAYLLVFRGPGAPPFFGNGYGPIVTMLEPSSYLPGADAAPTGHDHGPGLGTPIILWLAIGLLVFKAVGTALTLGSGGSGGVFAPSLFVGAAAGGAFGVALELMGLLPAGSSPATYALVGMSATLAGTSHAPLTAMLLLFEITRNVYVLLPIMLAAVVATIVARLLNPDSIYTASLRKRGILLGSSLDLTLLRRLTARDIDAGPFVAIHPEEPIARLLEMRNRDRINDFVIVNADGQYAGMVTGDDVRNVVLQPDAAPYLLVQDVLRKDLPVVEPDETLDAVMEKFAKHPVAAMALLESGSGRKVAGIVTLPRLMARYQRAIAEREAEDGR